MGRAYDQFIDALRDHGSLVKETGQDKAVAQCPAHDDRSPSLSIWPRDDGKGIRIKCHAGCDYHDILDALNSHPRYLFDDDDLRRIYRPDAQYDYGNRVKRRHQTRNGKTFEFVPAGVEDDHHLYGLERLTPEHTTVLVCEGEKAVDMCWQLGHPAVATGGASRTVDYTPLQGRHVTLIIDRDPAGDEWAQRQLKALEKIAATIECLQAKPAAPHADIVDHFEAGYTLRELAGYVRSDSPLLTRRFTGRWLAQQDFAPLIYHVPDVVPEGFGVLAAPPKSGKSWLVCGLALAVACGGIALGHIGVDARPVLYMALEDGPRRLQERCEHIMRNQPLPDAIEFITQAEHPTIAYSMLEDYLKQTRGEQPFIIIDTFAKIKPSRPPGADAYQHDYSVAGQLKALVDDYPGASVLAVHHTRKQETNDFVDAVSGTYGLAAAADYILVLARKRHATEAVLSVTGRDVHEAEIALDSDDGRWTLAGENLRDAMQEADTRQVSAKLGDRALEVLGFVNSHGEVRASDIIEKLGISKDQARTYLLRLADSERIQRVRRGVYAPLCAHVSSVSSVASFATQETLETYIYIGPEKSSKNALKNASFAEPPPAPGSSKWLTPVGEGRCATCGCHIATQGHRADCPLAEPPDEPEFGDYAEPPPFI